MIKGNIYVGGGYESLGPNAKEVPLAKKDEVKLKEIFKKYKEMAELANR